MSFLLRGIIAFCKKCLKNDQEKNMQNSEQMQFKPVKILKNGNAGQG